MKKLLLFTFVFISQFTKPTFLPYLQTKPIYLYGYNESLPQAEALTAMLNKFHVKFEMVSDMKADDHLYIICNAAEVDDFPANYIVYQNVSRGKYSSNYLNKLRSAIAVWDDSWENIKAYRNEVSNYYYFPENYEFADAVLVPCFLPIDVLPHYKSILMRSNTVDTEISSLLPLIFFHAYSTNPILMVEAGIALGNSSQIFDLISKIKGTKFFGIDIVGDVAHIYDNFEFGTFLRINDLNFKNYYAGTQYKSQKIDVVFIDTSHEYKHTIAEINEFVPLLSEKGILMFHDSNVTPLRVDGREGWWRINNTFGKMNPLASSNPRGVAPAIKRCFGIEFDETKYENKTFVHENITWQIIHYPFCNGLTVLKKIGYQEV